MKRTLLSIFFATCAILGSAQKIGEPTIVPISNYGDMYFTPGCFTKNGETLIVMTEGDKEVKAINIYDNEFNLIKTIRAKKSFSCADFVYASTNGFISSERHLYVTQTLFNNDDKFEYLEEIKGGLNIMSEDGTVLQTVKFDDNSSDCCVILSIDNKTYIQTRLRVGEGKYDMYLYPITRTATGVNSVGAPKRLHVSPTLASRNEPITVEIGDSEMNDREIAVVNAAGQTVFLTKVHVGDKSVTIDPGKLSRGLNIVKATNGNKAVEYCKILVR